MELVHRCCCGLDVHKQTVVACLLEVGADGRRRKELRTFGTMADDLLTLADWLRAAGCTHVAMESTGVYVRRFAARAIPPAGRTGSGECLWPTTYLAAKAQGDNSMSSKRGGPEGVYGPAPRGPCATVKAALPELQSPGMEPVIRRIPRLTRCQRDRGVQETRPEASRPLDGGQ